VRETVAYYRGRLRDITSTRRRFGTGFVPSAIADQQSTAVQRVIDSCDVARRQYRPSFYSGKITFLKAGRNWSYPQDPGQIWRGLADDFEIHVVPGEHLELVGLAAEHLARKISLCLEQTLRVDIAV
jgi:hypothetical protein